MWVDSRGLARDETIRADLCIVGAGAAGIALAMELAGRGLDVCLMESGGLELEAATQALYRGDIVGLPYYPLETARLRFFGGTTGHWTGLCRPLEDLDFERRDWVPRSGWPLRREELVPHYRRAYELLEIDADPDTDAPAKADRLPLPPGRVRSALMQFSPPTRFGRMYRKPLERASDVRVFLHANAVEIEREREAARVRGIRFATLEGGRFRVEARRYVVATGAIENARLLLASDAVERGGLANGHDLVGRYFMEHPHFDAAARWLLADGVGAYPWYAWPDPDESFRGRCLAVLAFPADVLRRERMLGFSAELQLVSPWQETAGWRSARLLARKARAGEWPDDLGEHLGRVMDDLGSVLEGAWAEARGVPGDGASYLLKLRVEQAPNPDSRVTLEAERDALGMRRPRLDWRLGEADLASVHRGLVLLARAVGAVGLGRVQVPEDDPTHAWAEGVRGGWHHMGTTRMAEDPAEGVVDADCRVHGLENLYLAGSSVFPTSGWANPTVTLVALAVRLADHLRSAFARGGLG